MLGKKCAQVWKIALIASQALQHYSISDEKYQEKAGKSEEVPGHIFVFKIFFAYSPKQLTCRHRGLNCGLM